MKFSVKKIRKHSYAVEMKTPALSGTFHFFNTKKEAEFIARQLETVASIAVAEYRTENDQPRGDQS